MRLLSLRPRRELLAALALAEQPAQREISPCADLRCGAAWPVNFSLHFS